MKPIFKLLFVALLTFTFNTYSQTFYKQFGAPGISEGGQCVLALPDGNILIGGFKGDSAFIMKAAPDGNAIWTRIFKPHPANPNLVFNLSLTPDNFILGAGNSRASSGTDYLPFYFKVDFNGNFQWIKAVSGVSSLYFRKLEYLTPTEYIAFGATYDLSGTFADPYTARIDANTGNMLWNSPKLNYITVAYIDDLLGVAKGNNGVSYSTGRIYIDGSNTGGMRTYVSKFDNQGNHLWSKYLLHTFSQTARLYGADIVYDNDSLTIMFYGDPFGTSTDFQVGLIRTDTMGNVAWSKNYEFTGSSYALSFKLLTTTSGYVLTGYVTTASNDLFLLATNKRGNLLWGKTYGTTTGNELVNLFATGNADIYNGNIYFVGSIISGGVSNMIFACADANGQIACMPGNTPNIIVTTNPLNSTACNVTALPLNLNVVSSPGSASNALADICPVVNLGNDTSICNLLVLNATTAGATSYLWSDGSVNPTLNVTEPGTYWVNVQSGCCFTSDTIVVSGLSASGTISASGGNCNSLYNFTVTPINAANTYQWNFGDGTAGSSLQAPSHSYANPGTYTVSLTTISQTGCVSISEYIVNFQSNTPAASFINGSLVCEGQQFSFINTSTGAQSFAWNFGDGDVSAQQSPDHIFGVAGSYAVQLIAYNNSCNLSDTIVHYINVVSSPVASLIRDTVLCSATSIILQVNPGSNSVLWSNGSVNSSITVNQSGEYWVMLNNGSCSDRDTVNVDFFIKPDLGPDLTRCGVAALLLDPGQYSSYLWSDNTVQQSTIINTSGTYWVEVTQGSCTARDSVTITIQPSLTVNLGADTSLCGNSLNEIVLDAGFFSGVTYTWSTGDTSRIISVSEPGSYSVIVDNGNCLGKDTIRVQHYNGIEIQDSFLICSQEEVVLSPRLFRNSAATYLWSTGENTPSITVGGPGVYSVSVFQEGCVFTDSSEVKGSISEGALYIPNSFTPGPDFKNDVFYAYGEGISAFSMKIFNRWGELVFQSQDISIGWDGTYKGHPVQQDLYCWIIDYETSCSEGRSVRKSGSVLLIL